MRLRSKQPSVYPHNWLKVDIEVSSKGLVNSISYEGLGLFKLADLEVSALARVILKIKFNFRIWFVPIMTFALIPTVHIRSMSLSSFFNSPLPLCIITPFGKEDKDSYIVVHSTTLVVGSIYGWSPF